MISMETVEVNQKRFDRHLKARPYHMAHMDVGICWAHEFNAPQSRWLTVIRLLEETVTLKSGLLDQRNLRNLLNTWVTCDR